MDAGTAYQILIHAPRGGSDVFGGYLLEYYQDFNPRSPWGERRKHTIDICFIFAFQSTLPVGGATDVDINGKELVRISIHAPRGGSDVM